MRRLTILLATVGALLLVPAGQAFAVPHLKVNIGGTGSGEVISIAEEEYFLNPTPPTACKYNGSVKSGVCEGEPHETEEENGFFVVPLEAIPAPGSMIPEGSWKVTKGAPECSFSPEVCYLTSYEEGEDQLEVNTTFCPEGEPTCNVFPLTIAEEGGEGTVVSNPAGIFCSTGEGVCKENFEKNTTITLTASPATGYAFSAWAGCTTHVGLTCTVTMDKAKTVKAKFLAIPLLLIEKTGTGAGKVGATGISCDESCSKATSRIKAGASVTVKVTPAKGSEAAVFEGGTGSASGCSGGTCTFTISEDSSVKVKFNAMPTKTLRVELTGPAAYKGKVTGKGTLKGLYGSAINCGAGCISQVESFFSTDEVTLSAAAGIGYTFSGWKVSGGSAGTCTGTTTPCTLKTDANKTVQAEFK